MLSKNPGLKIKVEFRVDPALKEELTQLNERLKREAKDRAFDADQFVEDSLREEIRAAHRELDALGAKKPNGGLPARVPRGRVDVEGPSAAEGGPAGTQTCGSRILGR